MPVRFWNCHGGSARTVQNFRPLTQRLSSSAIVLFIDLRPPVRLNPSTVPQYIGTRVASCDEIDKNAMAYRPGSFSKNFAWHGTGLRRLHEAIRKGFGGQLQSVGRDTWRRASGIGDDDLELIPLNFFLHNSIVDGKNCVSVDELVLQAITSAHSPTFDRLALFAFNLSRGGGRRGPNSGEARPAPWAGEFVRELLWKGGAWRREALDKETIDTVLETRLAAQPAVRRKVRSNYRHLFELCGYLPAHSEAIDSDPTSWGVAAAYLKWDRLTLDGELSPTANVGTLKNEAVRGDFHKLIGTTAANARRIVDVAAPLYVHVGRLSRATRTLQQLRSRMQTGTTPQYGSSLERSQRRAILERIAAVEREIERLRPTHGGIGHNNPPTDEPIAQTQQAISTIKEELKKEEPNAAVVAHQTSLLQAAITWLGRKIDRAVDKFADTVGWRWRVRFYCGPLQSKFVG